MIAYHLDKLGLRKEAYPFDWLNTPSCHIFTNLTALIKNNFADFMTNLKHNENNDTISENYPGTVFVHHDLVTDLQNEGKKFAAMERRVDRFQKRLHEEKVLLVCAFELIYCDIDETRLHYWRTIRDFKAECKKQGIDAEILLIVYADSEFTLEEFFEESVTGTGVHLRKFVRDKSVDEFYGSNDEFKKIMEEFYTF